MDKDLAKAVALMISSKRYRPSHGWQRQLRLPDNRRKALEILDEDSVYGGSATILRLLLGVRLDTLQRWHWEFNSNEEDIDGHKSSHRHIAS